MTTEKYVSDGTTLTEYQRELLTILVEECAEVAQRATKALRFGLDEVQSGQPFDNAYRLSQEIGDISCVVNEMVAAKMVNQPDIDDGFFHKKKQLARWMQHKEDK